MRDENTLNGDISVNLSLKEKKSYNLDIHFARMRQENTDLSLQSCTKLTLYSPDKATVRNILDIIFMVYKL